MPDTAQSAGTTGTTTGAESTASTVAEQQAGEQQPTNGGTGASTSSTSDSTAQQTPEQGANPLDSIDWANPSAARAYAEQQRGRIQNLSHENARSRINAKETAKDEGARNAVRELAKAVGIELPDDSPTVDSVSTELKQVSSTRDSAIAEAALLREAIAQGVDSSKLDYLAFKVSKSKDLGGVAPTDPAYGDTLKGVVSGILSQDPALKRTGSAAAPQQQDLGGAGSNSSEITQEQFDGMSIAERTKLFITDRATYNRLTGRA